VTSNVAVSKNLAILGSIARAEALWGLGFHHENTMSQLQLSLLLETADQEYCAFVEAPTQFTCFRIIWYDKIRRNGS